MQGRLYFRSDTRKPDEIFKTGFSPRIEMDQYWWGEALKLRAFVDNRGTFYQPNQAVDADPYVAVCLTTKFHSAPIFPLNEKDSYIYAVALPDLMQVQYANSIQQSAKDGYRANCSLEVLQTENTPTNVKDWVIDLHNLQVVQAAHVVKFFAGLGVTDTSVGRYAGWPLYAYEAIAYKIAPENIICAIHATRKFSQAAEQVECQLISPKVKTAMNKTFTVDSDITYNGCFSRAQILSLGPKGSGALRFGLFNYSGVKDAAIQEFKAAREEKVHHTPNISYGLGGKTF